MPGRAGVAIDTVPLPERPIRIVVPAEVAFDLGKFTKALGGLAERLGCRACLSGVDCTFHIERNFVINPATLAVESIASGGVIVHG